MQTVIFSSDFFVALQYWEAISSIRATRERESSYLFVYVQPETPAGRV